MSLPFFAITGPHLSPHFSPSYWHDFVPLAGQAAVLTFCTVIEQSCYVVMKLGLEVWFSVLPISRITSHLDLTCWDIYISSSDSGLSPAVVIKYHQDKILWVSIEAFRYHGLYPLDLHKMSLTRPTQASQGNLQICEYSLCKCLCRHFLSTNTHKANLTMCDQTWA